MWHVGHWHSGNGFHVEVPLAPQHNIHRGGTAIPGSVEKMEERRTDTEQVLQDLQNRVKLLQDDPLPVVNAVISFITMILVLIVLLVMVF